MRKKSVPAERTELRRRAEERLRQRAPRGKAPLPAAEVRRLVHELQVHQIELEMQNQELRAARHETEAGLARYTELFDFAPVGYATLARDETIRDVNHAGGRLLGRPRGAVFGTRFSDFIAIGQRTAFSALIARAQDGDPSESYEVELPRLGKPSVYVRVRATALARADAATLLVFENVTERKAWEEKLAASERMLREADRRKDEFLAILSHELRNPLVPIRNSLFVLERAEPGGEKAGNALRVLDRQVEHLTRLVDDLLDVSRIARGKIQLRRERLDLGDLVRRTIEDHRTSFESSGLRLESRLEPGAFWVNADAARLIEVVSNLLANSEKFTPRGGSVLVLLERAVTKAALEVRDTGVGIAPEMARHLFEPFAQAPQTMDRTRGGLGLGLAMVKALVELHGGTVRVVSEGSGRGTSITVLLPLDGAPEQVAHAEESPPVRSRRVLVIEDNRDAADSLRDALALSGHEVVVAYDGPSGIERAREYRPEVVICDIGLPGMDGYQVARAFRADPDLKDAYLVALTGYALPDDLDRAAEAGFHRHVAKPPSVEGLDRVLCEAPDVRHGVAAVHERALR